MNIRSRILRKSFKSRSIISCYIKVKNISEKEMAELLNTFLVVNDSFSRDRISPRAWWRRRSLSSGWRTIHDWPWNRKTWWMLFSTRCRLRTTCLSRTSLLRPFGRFELAPDEVVCDKHCTCRGKSNKAFIAIFKYAIEFITLHPLLNKLTLYILIDNIT